MRKVFSFILVSILLWSTLTGCTSDVESEHSSENIVLTLTSTYDLPEFEKSFEEKYPNIDLQIETLATAIINGEVTRRLRNDHGSDIIITNLPAGEIKDYTYDLSAEAFVENYQSSITKNIAINGENHYLPLPGAYYGARS